MSSGRAGPRGGRGAPSPPPDFSALVRRDLRVVAASAALTLVAWAVFVVGRFAQLGRDGSTAVVVIGAVVGIGSFAAWLAGPRVLRKERYLVLVPLFLVAPAGLLALHDLGSGLVVVFLSSAVGFGAAIAAGFAFAARRARSAER